MKIDRLPLHKTHQQYLAPSIAAAGAVLCGLLLAFAPHPVHASSKQAQAAGAAVFHDKGCQHCHGADLEGTDRGPDLSTVGKKWKKDHIEQQIREGGNGMPAFDELLQSDEVKSLVDFLSAKRKPAHKKPPANTPDPSKKPAPPKPADNDDSGE